MVRSEWISMLNGHLGIDEGEEHSQSECSQDWASQDPANGHGTLWQKPGLTNDLGEHRKNLLPAGLPADT